jgi:CelD/BcsL family acetyltransferase involved in cellulose biosynthesis
MLDGESIVDLGGLHDISAEWDVLAVACGLPQMSPAWLLAWWRHLAPVGAEPRAVAVREAGALVGLAPFFVEPRKPGRIDYRLPGIELAVRLAPLALPGREWHVAEAIARQLVEADPRPDAIALEGAPLASHWQTALCERWPGPVRPISRRYATYGCPTVSLGEGDYETWLARKSAHFRERMRKLRRKFEAAGGSMRLSTRARLGADVATLLRLHTTRWESLGASNLVARGERMGAMLEDVGERLIDEGRFRLMMLEVEGEPVSAHLALAAGGEVLGVNGGWSERWARLSPTVVHCLYLIEDAIARGERRIDLGLGEQSYKRRLADGDDPVAWALIVTPGRRMPLTLLRTAPLLARYAARDAAKRLLTDEQADGLRAARSRLLGGRAG